ncbi:MAG TPA: hypothetical protein VHR45_07485 [Thermoanaerobaculia bacterium]|nr:hypothetical protein [Thermoanaerobaculia bacterium]
MDFERWAVWTVVIVLALLSLALTRPGGHGSFFERWFLSERSVGRADNPFDGPPGEAERRRAPIRILLAILLGFIGLAIRNNREIAILGFSYGAFLIMRVVHKWD